jgi:hypothetical protein
MARARWAARCVIFKRPDFDTYEGSTEFGVVGHPERVMGYLLKAVTARSSRMFWPRDWCSIASRTAAMSTIP